MYTLYHFILFFAFLLCTFLFYTGNHFLYQKIFSLTRNKDGMIDFSNELGYNEYDRTIREMINNIKTSPMTRGRFYACPKRIDFILQFLFLQRRVLFSCRNTFEEYSSSIPADNLRLGGAMPRFHRYHQPFLSKTGL